MKIAHVSDAQLVRELTEIIGRYLDLDRYEIFFFGSRVHSDPSDRADIDVGIEGDGPVPGEVMTKIREEVEELPYLYKIDIVDFKRVSPDFYQNAKQSIEPISI